jgi:hypothetical protein
MMISFIRRLKFQEEFLLSAPGGLGMFVTSAGVSERPPIQWTKPVTRFIFSHPYIIALTESRDSVVVYRWVYCFS